MTPAALKKLLFEQIPLAEALQVEIARLDSEAAELTAPLEPNRNHLGTAFGGSLSAVLILAGYSWLYNAMSLRGFKCHVILKKSDIEYLKPVKSGFTAVAQSPNSRELEKFFDSFERKGTGRIVILAQIDCADGLACRLRGEFVARGATSAQT